MEAHHAIIPTANTRSINLSIDEQRIYELIARQYLLQFCPDAEYRKSKITLSIAGGTFVAKHATCKLQGGKSCLAKKTKMKIKNRYCRSSKRTDSVL